MITVSYFGSQPGSGAPSGTAPQTPVWSRTWQKSPFNKGAEIDWKTGTIRTPLYEPPENVVPEITPFVHPQWNVSIEAAEDGSTSIVVNSGVVAWQKKDESGKIEIKALEADSAVFEKVETSGWIYWVCDIFPSKGEIVFVKEGEDAPSEKAKLLLANILYDDVAGFSAMQKQSDTIFAVELDALNNIVVESDNEIVKIMDGHGNLGDFATKVTPVLDEDGVTMHYRVGIFRYPVTLEGMLEIDPPPCGHPGNYGGGGVGVGVQEDKHPGDTVIIESHIGDGEGKDGVTPVSSGDCA